MEEPSSEMLNKMNEICNFVYGYKQWLVYVKKEIVSHNEMHIHAKSELNGVCITIKIDIEKKFPEVVLIEYDWDSKETPNKGTLKIVIDLEKGKLPEQPNEDVDYMIYSRPSVFLSGRAIRQANKRNRK